MLVQFIHVVLTRFSPFCFYYFFSTYMFFYARPSFSCLCPFFFELSIEHFITFLLSYLCILAIQLLLVVIALRSQELPQQQQQLCKRKAACKRISYHPFSPHPHPFSSQWFLSAFLSKSSVIGTHQSPFFFQTFYIKKSKTPVNFAVVVLFFFSVCCDAVRGGESTASIIVLITSPPSS